MRITQEPHASQLGKVVQLIFLEVISKHFTEKKVTVRHQHGYLKAKSCLMNVIAFCDFLTGSVGERRREDVAYLIFSKAFDTVSHNNLTDKLMKYGPDKWTVSWTENCLNSQTQNVVLWGTKSS